MSDSGGSNSTGSTGSGSNDGFLGRAPLLDRALNDLLRQTPELEAAAVVSFDGLPMASALPSGMDEERVAAMSAALLSLGERAAAGLGRGELTQVYVEGENGTVFLISADDEAVLVAVAGRGAKTGLVLFEARRTARAVAEILRAELPGTAEFADAPHLVNTPTVPAQSPGNVSALRAVRNDIALQPVVTPEGWASWGNSTKPTTNDSTGGADSGSVSPTTPW